jgi:serine protease
MKRSPLVISGLLVLAAAAPFALRPRVRASELVRVASVRPPSGLRQPYRTDQLIVKFRPTADNQVAERAIRFSGGRSARPSRYGNRFLVQLQEGVALPEALARFSSLPEVEYAEPNGVVRAFQGARFTPNDRLYNLQWHMRMVDAERTWGIQKGNSDVAVAVLDTGIAFEDFGPYRKAPDFGGTVFLPGHDFINDDTHANDDNFHGTHVASTIAEATDNGEGVSGLAFNCALMPVKVLDETGTGELFQVAEGIDYAVNFRQNGVNPVKVINLSLGGESGSETLRQAVDRAFDAGITVVAAAGNESVGEVGFPAAFDNAIAVGALDGRKQKAPYSNFGRALDVMAPGGDSRRDDTGVNGAPDGRPDGVLQQTFDPDTAEFEGRFDDFAYFFVSGTSQATPHVAALACLLYQQGIRDPAAIRAAIEGSAEDLGAPGRDDTFGFGLIRPSVALAGFGLNQK